MVITRRKRRGKKRRTAGVWGFNERDCVEFLDWGLSLVKKALLPRPERRKVLLVLHDGEPVYNGKLGNDYQMSF